MKRASDTPKQTLNLERELKLLLECAIKQACFCANLSFFCGIHKNKDDITKVPGKWFSGKMIVISSAANSCSCKLHREQNCSVKKRKRFKNIYFDTFYHENFGYPTLNPSQIFFFTRIKKALTFLLMYRSKRRYTNKLAKTYSLTGMVLTIKGCLHLIHITNSLPPYTFCEIMKLLSW